METVLVTGTAGFIGSNFIRKALFNKSQFKFVTIDGFKNKHCANNLYINRNLQFYLGDVSDRHFIDTVFSIEKPKYIIHLAAESFVDDAINNATNFIQSNVVGTQVLVDVAVKYQVEQFIYCSTDEVYGQLTDIHASSWTEESCLAPRNPYSASKAAGEMIVKAAHYTHGLNYKITRSCNNFGPRQPSRNLIPKIVKHILTNQPVPIYGQGKQCREWIHVDDFCSALLLILEKASVNEIYNVSSGYEFSNLEMFHRICDIMEDGFQLLSFVKERPGHDFRYSIDASKLKKLDWKPSLKFKDALIRTVNWYVNNKWFLEIGQGNVS